MRRFIVLALLCLPAVARAQAERSNTIAPGMTRAQVVAALGGPATQRTTGEFTYMFYPNSCGRACGMNDLVILKHDSVSDAIFRSPNRRYTGTSSSPQQAVPEVTARRAHPASNPMNTPKAERTTVKAAAKPAPKPAPVKTAGPAPMKPPAKANDTKPSIPANPPTIQPAPAKTTAPAPTKSTAPAKAPAPDKKPG